MDLRGQDGETPLLLAAKRGSLELVQLLLSHPDTDGVGAVSPRPGFAAQGSRRWGTTCPFLARSSWQSFFVSVTAFFLLISLHRFTKSTLTHARSYCSIYIYAHIIWLIMSSLHFCTTLDVSTSLSPKLKPYLGSLIISFI